MTYFDTLQQNPAHNWQSNPQGWSAFNAPWMQAMAGYSEVKNVFYSTE